MARILLAEDDPSLGPALRDLLIEESFDVTWVTQGDDALHMAQQNSHDIHVLDVMLPAEDGFAIVRTLREEGDRTPILLLTARDRVEDRVRGLEAGADDYLVKPFASTELIARIRALLRRSSPEFADPDVMHYCSLHLRVSTREFSIDGEAASILTPKESALLELFLRYPGIVLTRSQLIDRLWGYEADVLENTLEVHVSRLRKRLEHNGCPNILTVRGLGYRLQKGN